jgi:hypothetical protein
MILRTSGTTRRTATRSKIPMLYMNASRLALRWWGRLGGKLVRFDDGSCT